MSACVGAIVAPFVIDLDTMATSSFIVMACLLFVNFILCILTPETNEPSPADSSTSTHVHGSVHVHTIDLNIDSQNINESSTDTSDCHNSEVSLEDIESPLGTIEEETSSNDTYQITEDTYKDQSDDIDTSDLTLSIDRTMSHSTTEIDNSSVKKGKMSRKTGNISKKLFSKENPISKQKKCKVEKNVEHLHGKSKSKPKDDSLPYIESEYHKNIRYSIY